MKEKKCPLSINNFRKDEYIILSRNVYCHKSLDKNAKIYKYMALNHFVNMLVDNQFYIANRKTFTDKREHGWKEDLRLYFGLAPAGNSKWAKEERKRLSLEKDYVKEICISCWTIDKHDGCDESYLMWKAYGVDRCRIETTLARLLSCLELNDYSVFIRPVIYRSEKRDDSTEDKIFTKTLEYQDEQEIRICFLSNENSINLRIKDFSFINKIRLSPFYSKTFNKVFEDGLISKFNFLDNKVELSHIAEY